MNHYVILYEPFCYIIFFHFSLFLLFKIIRVYLQNIPRDAFLFRLRIGTVYHGENFLITKTSNSWIKQDLKNTEDAIEHSNQTNSFSLTINATYDFALS